MPRIKRIVIEGDRIEVEFFDEEDRNIYPPYSPDVPVPYIPYTPYPYTPYIPSEPIYKWVC